MVDFNTVKNLTLFVVALGKITIINELVFTLHMDENRKTLNLVNFSSIYDKIETP